MNEVLYNLKGLAIDAWIDAVPDDVYDPCPCGCGKKFRFIAKDEKTLIEHEEKFIRDYIESFKAKK